MFCMLVSIDQTVEFPTATQKTPAKRPTPAHADYTPDDYISDDDMSDVSIAGNYIHLLLTYYVDNIH
jgi:hypothetical protein